MRLKADSVSQAPYPVIFDTDPGVDDAMALYFALAHPGIELLGITTTFGNVSSTQAAVNALYLLEIAGRNIPVTQGIATPWVKTPEAPPAHIHGADGLGNLGQRLPVTQSLDPRTSAQFIVDMARARPGEITLVAVGPLGNLGLALKLEPHLPQLVREVIVMGGTVLEPGNVSPVAEANIWNDPHAADAVFSAGWKLTMVGLDVTHQLILPTTLFRQIALHHQHRATNTLLHAVEFYANFYSQRHSRIAEIKGCFGHDVLAFIFLVNPDLFVVASGHVSVVTEGLAQSQTLMSRPQDAKLSRQKVLLPRTQVCLQLDANAAKSVFSQTLISNWLG